MKRIPPDLNKALTDLKRAKRDIQKRIKEIAWIGKDPRGGVTRLAYSQEENKAFEYVKEVGISIGLNVKEDAIGNLYLTLPGRSEESVIIGSHLDTVPQGGRFDGAMGIACYLEIAKALSHVDLEKNLVIAVFRAEESSRFMISLIGSSAATGQLDSKALEIRDSKGIRLWEAIERCGFYPRRLDDAKLNLEEVAVYLEYHVEQGPVLETYGCPIGVVTAISAPARYEITLRGMWAHSGTTPMNLRKDALIGAAEIILAVNEVCSKRSDVVGTVGDLKVPAGSINKVPGEVVLYLDVRSVDERERKGAIQEIMQLARKKVEKHDLHLNLKSLEEKLPQKLSDRVVRVLELACDLMGVEYLLMPSGASHDALNFSKAGIPTGMLFCQSKGGVSHSSEEFSELDHILIGAQVLLVGIYQLMQEQYSP